MSISHSFDGLVESPGTRQAMPMMAMSSDPGVKVLPILASIVENASRGYVGGDQWREEKE